MMLVFLLLAAAFGSSLQQCDPTRCLPPKCRCYNDKTAPGNLSVSDIPQIVMVSFEGTINKENILFYNAIFSDLMNPNDCPARGTFFIQDDGSEYRLIKQLYDQGHEIGIHSLDGKAPNDSSSWISTLQSVLQNLNDVGIKQENVRGVRVPQLAIGGNDEFIGIGTVKMLYDSSCANSEFSDAASLKWPYTYDYVPSASCDIGQAPDKPFAGKWEVYISDLHDLDSSKTPCPVPSACHNITTKKNAFDLFFNAFADHYNGGRTPFLMIVDPAFASINDLRDGTIEFLQYIRAAFGTEVWVVPIFDMLQWMQQPTPIKDILNFAPWKC